MKTLKYKNQLIVALHLLFWIVSFNVFNSFFSRGIGSGYNMDGLELTWLNVFYISNASLFFILMPLIWFVKGTKRWIKWGVTAVLFIMIVWGTIATIFFDQKFYL